MLLLLCSRAVSLEMEMELSLVQAGGAAAAWL